LLSCSGLWTICFLWRSRAVAPVHFCHGSNSYILQLPYYVVGHCEGESLFSIFRLSMPATYHCCKKMVNVRIFFFKMCLGFPNDDTKSFDPFYIRFDTMCITFMLLEKDYHICLFHLTYGSWVGFDELLLAN